MVMSNSATLKKSEVSTLSKTPPQTDQAIAQAAAAAGYVLTPMLFKRKQESRF